MGILTDNSRNIRNSKNSSEEPPIYCLPYTDCKTSLTRFIHVVRPYRFVVLIENCASFDIFDIFSRVGELSMFVHVGVVRVLKLHYYFCGISGLIEAYRVRTKKLC